MMTPELDQLVRETIEVTGASPPAIMDQDAPILTDVAVGADEQALYFVGLIGGKDVGKSALVNALVGREITPRTSHGPGTETVIAYVHQSQAQVLGEILNREVPGRFTLVTHTVELLRRQVLLDLPDIDSHYSDHIEITRRMLRHMLYPIWMQSIEKYADQQPQSLLAKVAAGNSPANFIFCLNKVDQLTEREGPQAVSELAEDYARRLMALLKLNAPPRIWMISAIHPDRYELPALRSLLSQERTTQRVEESRQLAQRQQTLSLADWLRQQDLPARAQRLARLQEDAEETLSQRVGSPLMDQVIPQLMDDPAHRLALIDECMQQRVRRWPVVNVIHVLFAPLVGVLRRRLSLEQQRGLQGPEMLVDLYLRPEDAPVSSMVQSAFAQLQQTHPALSNLYRQQKLWEEMHAEAAAEDLRHLLGGVLQRQRELARSRVAVRGRLLGLPFRWQLTFGAVLWFPFLQPLLAAYLQSGGAATVRELLVLLVQLFGVNYLLKNVVFLAIYFAVLWLILRWDTQRRISRLLLRWRSGGLQDPSVNLAAQVLQWMDELLEPIRSARQRVDLLAEQATALQDAVAR